MSPVVTAPCVFLQLCSHRGHGWADRLTYSQQWKQRPEKWRWGKSWARRYQMTHFSVFPSQTPKNVLPAYITGGLLPEAFKSCFCCLCRSPDVAAGPRGGRGRSQWRTATHPRPRWRATSASWTTGGSSSAPSAQTCPFQRSQGCWATSGASCLPRRSRSVKELHPESYIEHTTVGKSSALTCRMFQIQSIRID